MDGKLRAIESEGQPLTLLDLAKKLDLSPAKVRRWLRMYWHTQFQDETIYYSTTSNANLVANGSTAVEFLTFYELRKKGLSVQKIMLAHHVLSSTFQMAHPFAYFTILTDGETIFIKDADGELIRADKSLQLYFSVMMEKSCQPVRTLLAS
ncbi:MAG: hypothetical protein ACK4R6_09800 [Spirosomataceae bacterium]